MTTQLNLNTADLDFFTLRENLKDWMKNQPTFSDYDFEGSSLTVLLDLLAYNTHYVGMYAHMLANEAFIDSSKLVSSLTSKAKLFNYVPRSMTSAYVDVVFEANVDAAHEPDDHRIVIERGSQIIAKNNASDTRTFTPLDDIYLYNRSDDVANPDYRSDVVRIYEGEYSQWKFVVNSNLVNQRFVIEDTAIDISTMKINVYDSITSDSFVTYTLATDFMEINDESPVYFLSMNELGFYEISFGNGVYGQKVSNGNYIQCTFVRSSGVIGNNAKTFSFPGTYTYNGNPYLIEVVPQTVSSGGGDAEDAEELRFNIPYHYRRQNRVVTADDYRTLILATYTNVNSINVWGGEDNVPPVFGKVFISIKPKYGEVLSSAAKTRVKDNIVGKYNVVSIDVDILDPNYLYIELDVTILYNPIKTNRLEGELITLVNDAIARYDDVVLNKFKTLYSDVDMNHSLMLVDPSIVNSTSEIRLKKIIPVVDATDTTYTVDFLHEIEPGTLITSIFKYRNARSYLKDDGNGNLICFAWNDTRKKYVQYSGEKFGTIDYTTGSIVTIGMVILDTDDVIFRVNPTKYQFFSKRNTIITISDHQVEVIPYLDDEANKK